MSHNILKLNSNSFDVNSNRTESISDAEFFYCQNEYGTNYPATLSTSSDFLIYRAVVIKNPSTPSWLTENNDATHTSFLSSITLTQDGTYLITGNAGLRRTAANTGGAGFTLYNKTTSTIISNSVYYNYNELSYLFNRNMSTIVVRSGSNVEVSIRPFLLSNVDTDTRSYWQSRLIVEKLQ